MRARYKLSCRYLLFCGPRHCGYFTGNMTVLRKLCRYPINTIAAASPEGGCTAAVNMQYMSCILVYKQYITAFKSIFRVGCTCGSKP